MERLKGIGVSPGVVAGRAVVLIQRAHVLRYQIAPARLDRELRRLDDSRVRSREQLIEIQSRLTARRPELASLFDAQLLMLDDPMLLPGAADIVREQRVNAEWAVQQVFHEVSAMFEEFADPYLQERRGDVADLVGRLRMNLRQGVATPRDLLRDLDESSVLIADELTPSIAAQVDWTRVRGFATDVGSRTYHTAILARSLDVPAVVGLHNASERVRAGQIVVIDGSASEVIIEPTSEELARAAHHADDHRPAAPVDADRKRPAATADGVPIRLDANIEFPDDLAAARYAGAEGIGLYRSEFLVTGGAEDIGDEDRQYEIYRGMLEGMAPGSVTVRTFDVDEEQLASRLAHHHPLSAGWEPDEARASRQGLRGLRLSLTRPDLFRVQLRALLRAARHGSLRIMFPFVSSGDHHRARDGGRRGRRRSVAARRAGGAGAGRRHDRDSGRRVHGGSTREGSRLFHDRDQRSDSVLPGGRPGGRTGLAVVRTAASSHPPHDPHGAAGGLAPADSGVALRGNGVGPGAADAAGRFGPDRVQHDARSDPHRQAGARRAAQR